MPEARVINLFGSAPAPQPTPDPPATPTEPPPGFASIEDFKEVVIPELENLLGAFEVFDEVQWQEWLDMFRAKIAEWPR